MNLWPVLGMLIGGSVVGIAEYLRRCKRIDNETARKIIHIAHALTVSIWPFFISYTLIIGAEILFIVIVLMARKFHKLEALRSVKRQSWGEIFFALGIIALAILSTPPLIFLAAILHLGIADGVAALVGQRLKSKVYYVFGQRKTVAGTAAFVLTALAIIATLAIFTDMAFTIKSYVLGLLFIPLAAALAENLSPYGSDNLTIPLVIPGLFIMLGIN